MALVQMIRKETDCLPKAEVRPREGDLAHFRHLHLDHAEASPRMSVLGNTNQRESSAVKQMYPQTSGRMGVMATMFTSTPFACSWEMTRRAMLSRSASPTAGSSGLSGGGTAGTGSAASGAPGGSTTV